MNRYACAETSCRGPDDSATPRYFQTWSELQAHHRDEHPRTCPHIECEGQTFTTQKGLRAHLKVHEERAADAEMGLIVGDEDDEVAVTDVESTRVAKRTRRGGESGREWECEEAGCELAFKSVSPPPPLYLGPQLPRPPTALNLITEA